MTSTRSQPPDSRSPLRRALGYVDPAQPGFLRRMARLAGLLSLVALCALAAAGIGLLQTYQGRYWTGVLAIESGQEAAAERIARGLLDEAPRRQYNTYRLLATALRRKGEHEAQLAVYEQAAEVYPYHWKPQGHLCWYTTLFGEPQAVLDRCDRAVRVAQAIDASHHNLGFVYSWRGTARARAGDLAGARADLKAALAHWDQGYDGSPALLERRRTWLERLEAGRSPFDEEMLEVERGTF